LEVRKFGGTEHLGTLKMQRGAGCYDDVEEALRVCTDRGLFLSVFSDLDIAHGGLGLLVH
jgi:hypothetical protein